MNDIELYLDDLTRALVGGSPAMVEEKAGQVSAAAGSLSGLLDSSAVERIRDRVAVIRALVEHGEGVCRGLAGILGLLDEGGRGSQYSPRGEPTLGNIPRLVREG